MTDYSQHLTDINNVYPLLRSAAARNDWTLVWVHATRIADSAARVAGHARAEEHARELIRRADEERAARQAQLAILANAEVDE